MSANKHIPHVLVLPEDDANTEIATGFSLHEALRPRAIQVLPCAGGWPKVRDSFRSDHINAMRRNSHRRMVLLVDFDEKESRFKEMTETIPADLAERVFVIGVWKEAEDLTRAGLGSREAVGYELASECFDDSKDIWDHSLLRHNADELARMTKQLRPMLFPSS
ncbi:MAG: hypothetical protein ABI614_08770 [Planctomycetota bacterium]